MDGICPRVVPKEAKECQDISVSDTAKDRLDVEQAEVLMSSQANQVRLMELVPAFALLYSRREGTDVC